MSHSECCSWVNRVDFDPLGPRLLLFSNRPSGVSTFRLSTTAMSMSPTGSRFSSESAPGRSIMGSEDEVEQSLPRPCLLTNGRFKRTCELTSSIVPRGTSFHRSVELEFPSIGFDPAQLSCCCGFPAPPELGAINPHAVYDHGQSACQRHDRLFHPAELVKALLETEFATASDTQSAIGEQTLAWFLTLGSNEEATRGSS